MDERNRRRRGPQPELRKPPTKKKRTETDEQNARKVKFRVFRIVFLACLAYLSYQILAIKQENGDEYEQNALRQLVDRSTGDRVILPNRGAIMDRNNQALALSSTVYDIYIDVRTLLSYESDKARELYLAKTDDEKKEIADRQTRTLEIIHQVLGVAYGVENMDMDSLRANLAIDPKTGRPVFDSYYRVIAQNVKRAAAIALEDALAEEGLRHVYKDEDTERKYVYDNLASSLLGFQRGDTSWGLEQQYNAALTGVPGRVFNAFGESGTVESERVPPVEGNTLITTLDLAMQQYAERVCEKYAKLYEAPYAGAIIMDPYTAEIYAIAQYPTFNLNAPADVSYINKEEYAQTWGDLPMDDMLLNLNTIWTNFNLTTAFEPGSIYKPITVASALEEGVIKTTDTFYCGGSYDVNGIPLPCHNLLGHGEQTLEQSIANSCNVAMMQIAEKLGREKFHAYKNAFGFGDRTGIDLPYEAFGRLHPYSQFHAVELAVASFGQRFTCTAMQAITSFCATINGGNVMRPYVVSQVVDENGRIIDENKPLVQRRVVSQATSDFLRLAMESTISAEGTGRRAVIDGWAIGGKTATGEQGIKDTEDYSYTVSFITYFPVENPQYAVLALIHHVPEYQYEDNNASAAAMVKELMLDIIKYKAIPPSYDASDATLLASDTLLMSDYIGKPIDEATRLLNQTGLDYELVGGSCAVVTGQFPASGSRISHETTVFLTAGTVEGAELVELPSVLGLEVPQAEALLAAAGFTPYIVTPVADSAENQGAIEAPVTTAVITKQMPEAGIKLLRGSEIRLKTE